MTTLEEKLHEKYATNEAKFSHLKVCLLKKNVEDEDYLYFMDKMLKRILNFNEEIHCYDPKGFVKAIDIWRYTSQKIFKGDMNGWLDKKEVSQALYLRFQTTLKNLYPNYYHSSYKYQQQVTTNLNGRVSVEKVLTNCVCNLDKYKDRKFIEVSNDLIKEHNLMIKEKGLIHKTIKNPIMFNDMVRLNKFAIRLKIIFDPIEDNDELLEKISNFSAKYNNLINK